MNSGTWLGLVAALLGGVAVSLVTYITGRGKARAEIEKIEAETDRIRADTATLMLGINQASPQQPKISGWVKVGSRPDDYTITIDRSVAHSGNASALIEAQLGARGFGSLKQTFKSISMRGKRIRMSAYVKTEDVEWAALWMRVDGSDDVMLSFDNMGNRPIAGTSDWHRHEVVLDVADDSLAVAFGALLAGRGRIWLDDFEFEEVATDVDTTDLLKGTPVLPWPFNLDFEE